MNQSMAISTINNVEFISLQPLDINPLMSECEIKVLYLGKNRNGSFISKEVATEMAKTLRGAPIVGYYKEDKGDYGDHGDRVIIDDEGVKFESLTKPYGFVSPDAKVWFKVFEEEDSFGNTIEREYLMTTGYLWTGQYEEAQQVIDDGGKPQSMELDDKTLNGEWSNDINNGLDFFIINDAIFSKLCILGDDVEPCFEGSTISEPEVSTSFTKIDDNFKNTLFNMMNELKFVLKGGEDMTEEKLEVSVEETVDNEVETVETTETVEETTAATTDTEFSNNSDDVEESPASDFTKEEDDEKKEEETETKEKDDDKEEEKDKYSLLEEQHNELQEKYSVLKVQYEELLQFKKAIEKKEKEELINSFYMLEEEDKKDVRENIDKYSKDDIESKLSVICVRKKVNFSLEESDNNDNNIDDVNTTFNLNSDNSNYVPAWVLAVKDNEQ